MGLLVQKYGGSILETTRQILKIADHVVESRKRCDNLVVVVSAMKGATDNLIRLANEITSAPNRRELDMLLTAGERISMSLLSMALHSKGVPARSLTGSQCGIVTNESHNEASILELRGTRIWETLKAGEIVIVAGFQGVSRNREVTTLGRGGADITAVALAGMLGASMCELYKDVDGIFDSNPALSKQAKRLDYCDYAMAEDIARRGAKVLHPEAVVLAARYNLPLHIRSFDSSLGGTLVAGRVPPNGTVLEDTGRIYGRAER